MSKQKYPAVTRDFGPPITHELPPDYPQDYYGDEENMEKKPVMSHTATKLSRTELLAHALASATPRPTRAGHLKILTEEEWRMVHTAKGTEPKTGLQQLFLSMQHTYQENDEAFFKDYTQFYNTYRVAMKALGLFTPRVKKES